MKRLFIGILSVLAVAGTATAVKAEQDTQVYGDPSDGGPGYTYDTPNVDDANTGDNYEMDSNTPSVYDDFSRRDEANDMSGYRTSPFELTYLAYSGYLEDQGIESYSTLLQNIELGDTDAEDLIAAGIESGRLSPMAMEDEGYENSVRFMMQRLQVESE
ncbi:MAG: hypothetical protein ACTS2F_05910 [Thainema sp.]